MKKPPTPMRVDELGPRKFVCVHQRLSPYGRPTVWFLRYVSIRQAANANNGLRIQYQRMADEYAEMGEMQCKTYLAAYLTNAADMNQ